MQITIFTFTTLVLTTMIPVSLATPDPFPALTGSNSDRLQKLDPSLDGSDDVPHKSWTWNPITVSKCKQAGQLKIYQDGHLQWDAVIWQSWVLTTSIWYSTFQLKTSAGQVLYSAGPYDSPRTPGCCQTWLIMTGMSMATMKLMFTTKPCGWCIGHNAKMVQPDIFGAYPCPTW